ncbi:unnamed protein product [Rotaria sp. Silwood2]|nr:unnamed protein product [Rotaria sp. Silwood2]CAF3855703.1 unnamed protein product [Rotaria sp. Silwood2]
MYRVKLLLIIWLLFVSRLESYRLRRQSSCSWVGHCAGDSCSSNSDCDGTLDCTNGICGGGVTDGGTTDGAVTDSGTTDDTVTDGGGTGDSGTDTSCSPSGQLTGTSTSCNTENESTCCQSGVDYPQYTCSPSSAGSALLTLNSFQEGGDGGGGGACDGSFYPDSEPVVALSTGWYNGGSRCGRIITIKGNGRSTTATVVDECDSVHGCDADHAGQPPCRNNIVDGSKAVWDALGVSQDDPRYGEMSITWND